MSAWVIQSFRENGKELRPRLYIGLIRFSAGPGGACAKNGKMYIQFARKADAVRFVDEDHATRVAGLLGDTYRAVRVPR